MAKRKSTPPSGSPPEPTPDPASSPKTASPRLRRKEATPPLPADPAEPIRTTPENTEVPPATPAPRRTRTGAASSARAGRRSATTAGETAAGKATRSRKPRAGAGKNAGEEAAVAFASSAAAPEAATAAKPEPAAQDRLLVSDPSTAGPVAPAKEIEVPSVPEVPAGDVQTAAVAPEKTPAAPAEPAARTDAGGDGLNVLMIASEMVPFAKTGGLADVAGALPRALGKLGHRVVVALPRYRGVSVAGAPIATFSLPIGSERYEVRLFAEDYGANATVWFVDIPPLFDRDGIYGIDGHDHPDNPRRYAALVRAAFEGALEVGFAPDLVHAHDWQGGLAPVYLRTRYAGHPVLGGVPSVFTIHNIAYKGLCDPGWIPELDLGWELFRPQAIEYWGQVSLLKAGINFSEKITTVSRRYAEEILTPEFAFGFEGILAARRADLVGILNGIDTETWDPSRDPHIPAPYSAANLAGKRAAKQALLQAYGLPSDEAALRVPLVGMVSRMVEQKGLDLIAAAASELPHLGARFVILGTGEARFENMWRDLGAQFPDRIGVRIGFDEALSHLLEAGSDLFLMPSRFEPCGLNQMYSLRYGTLPLVRATGGLDDTVENYDPYTGAGNGFKFWEASAPALVNTLRWALRVYEHPEVWSRLQQRAMAGDFSWERSARLYEQVYDQALAKVGRARSTAARA